jgi:hypothetical protein
VTVQKKPKRKEFHENSRRRGGITQCVPIASLSIGCEIAIIDKIHQKEAADLRSQKGFRLHEDPPSIGLSKRPRRMPFIETQDCYICEESFLRYRDGGRRHEKG